MKENIVTYQNNPDYWINKTFIKTLNPKVGFSFFEYPIVLEGFLCEEANTFKLTLRKINFLAKIMRNKDQKQLKLINVNECLLDLIYISEIGFTEQQENIKYEYGKIANEFWEGIKYIKKILQ